MTDTSKPGTPLPDPNTIPELVQLGKSLDANDQAAEQSHYEIGVTINQKDSAGLPRKYGYPDMAHVIRLLRPQKYASYMLYARVARAFPADAVGQLGMTLLDEILRYTRAANVRIPADLSQLMIPVPDKRGHVTSKPATQCSVSEVKSAEAALTPPLPLSPASQKIRDALQQALEDTVGKHGAVEAVPNGADAIYSLKNIPEVELGDALREALQAFLSLQG